MIWQYIKNKINIKTSNPSNPTSEVATSDEEKAEVLSKQIQSVFTEKANDISKESMFRQLNSIGTSKSPGPDNIHPRILKEL